MEMYDSKYLRGTTPNSQSVHVEGYDVNYWKKLVLLGRYLRGLVPRR